MKFRDRPDRWKLDIRPVRKGWLLLGIAAMIGVSGCAGGPEGAAGDEDEETAVEKIGEEEAPKSADAVVAAEEIYVGNVNYVSGADGFVLIEVVVSARIEAGERLFARSADGRNTGEMTLSPERKHWYLIGDIISGYPQVGDRIYYKRAAEGGQATTEEDHRDQRRGSEKENSGARRFGGR